MRKMKRETSNWLLYDYANIERHLEKRALQGWKLIHIGNFIWKYKKIEPTKLKYTVTYFKESSDFNGVPTENEQSFESFCEMAGWQKVGQRAQMQVFCTDKPNPEPFDTEPSVKFDNIHSAMRKNFLPGQFVLLFLFALQIFMQIRMLRSDPVSYLSSHLSLFNLIMQSGLFLGFSINLALYYMWHQKSEKYISEGRECPNPITMPQSPYWGTLVIGDFIFLLSDQSFLHSNYSRLFVVFILIFSFILFAVIKVREKLKSKGLSRESVRNRTVAFSVVIIFIYISGTNIYLYNSVDRDTFKTYKAVKTVTIDRGAYKYTRDVYSDPIPITIDDINALVSSRFPNYSYQFMVDQSSPLLTYQRASQDAYPLEEAQQGDYHIDFEDAPEMNYVIIETEYKWVHNIVIDDMMSSYYDGELTASGMPYWIYKEASIDNVDADALYQLWRDGEPVQQFLLVDDLNIMMIRFDWDAGEEDVVKAYDDFGNILN